MTTCKRQGCGKRMDGLPKHWAYCSWRCMDEDKASEIGVPPTGWSDDDLDLGNGWESDDF